MRERSREQSMVALPKARVEQLRQIAEDRGITVADLLDGFITDQWRKLGRPDEPPPGYAFETVGTPEQPFILIYGEDLPRISTTPQQARVFAKGILKVLEAGGRANLEGDPGILVFGRRGRGFALLARDPDSDEPVRGRGMTGSVARDFARALLACAEQAKRGRA